MATRITWDDSKGKYRALHQGSGGAVQKEWFDTEGQAMQWGRDFGDVPWDISVVDRSKNRALLPENSAPRVIIDDWVEQAKEPNNTPNLINSMVTIRRPDNSVEEKLFHSSGERSDYLQQNDINGRNSIIEQIYHVFPNGWKRKK